MSDCPNIKGYNKIADKIRREMLKDLLGEFVYGNNVVAPINVRTVLSRGCLAVRPSDRTVISRGFMADRGFPPTICDHIALSLPLGLLVEFTTLTISLIGAYIGLKHEPGDHHDDDYQGNTNITAAQARCFQAR